MVEEGCDVVDVVVDEDDVSPSVSSVEVIPPVVTTTIRPVSAPLTMRSMTERRSAESNPDTMVRPTEKLF